jgi:DNA-binding CsgD family transcriptional regulator
MTDGSSDAPGFDWGNDRFTVISLRLRLPPDLTRAEREVVELVLRGYTDREVAAYRGTAARTVANQLRAVYGKLGINSRAELVAWCCGAG